VSDINNHGSLLRRQSLCGGEGAVLLNERYICVEKLTLTVLRVVSFFLKAVDVFAQLQFNYNPASRLEVR
jgi:hypothetical protein